MFLKVLHYFFSCFLKIKMHKKTHFQFHNIVIGNNREVSLACCGPLQVMLVCSFIPRLHFQLFMSGIFGFSTVLVQYRASTV